MFVSPSSGIVESVGLGQSEIDIDQAVDLLLLIVPPGGGDGLQASKKGIMEAADIILVNKADGDLMPLAQSTKADYSSALHFVRRKNENWGGEVFLMSAKSGFGVDKVLDAIGRFRDKMTGNGALATKRVFQQRHWM